MDDEDRLRLDYDITSKQFLYLADARFKLLAIVPTVTGTAIAFVGQQSSPERSLVIGLLGFLVTFGLIIYDQRNTQIYEAMGDRAKCIEANLGFKAFSEESDCGGAFLNRPKRSRRFLGILMWHDLGLAIIHASVQAGWSYLIVQGLVGFASSKPVLVVLSKIIVPVTMFILFFWQLLKQDKAS